MVLIHDWSITSSLTPETAHRLRNAAGDWWTLSWLPGVVLTRTQAISGVVLDEILSDPRLVANGVAIEMAGLHAEILGIDLAQALLRLYTRTGASQPALLFDIAAAPAFSPCPTRHRQQAELGVEAVPDTGYAGASDPMRAAGPA